MQTSVINYKDLNYDLRIDAEYYRTEVLQNVRLLDKKNSDTLENLAKFIIGPFGSTVKVDQYVQISDYRYIRNKDINDFIIYDDDPALIHKDIYVSLPQYHIKKNDLLITVVGTLGKVAIAQDKDTKSIFSCKSTIIRPNNIDPYYLLTYLNSKIGQTFILRGTRGAIQKGLNLPDLKEIKVYIPLKNFQNFIRTITCSSFELNNKATLYYSQAEQILLSELDLLNWKPKHQKVFIKKYSDTVTASRIDAEYFQPMYDEIVDKITSLNNFSTLDRIVSIKKCIEPGSNVYQDNGIVFLRISNLSKFGFKNGNQQYINDDLYAQLIQYQPKKGEILLTKDASPGIAYYLKDDPGKMIPSGGILRLRLKDENILLPEYLTLVLNSIIVQKQIERDIGGSVINHWLVDQVKSALIPILPIDKQSNIAKMINKSFSNCETSKKLLDIAKRGVEMAIEQDENSAEYWIKSEIEDLGIDIDT